MSMEQRFLLFNKFYSDKIYTFKGQLLNNVNIDIEIDYKIKIIGTRQFIVVGELVDHVSIDLEILDVNPKVFSTIFEKIDDGATFMSRYYTFSKRLLSETASALSLFSINEEPWFEKIHMKKENTLTEAIKPRSTVRTIVNDIIKIFKEKGVGYFELPEDLNGEMTYTFGGMDSELTVEVNIIKTNEVDGLDVDGGYYKDEDTLEIEIMYNPTYGTEIMYDLVGKLNEVVRHELQHVIQYERGDKLPNDEPSTPEKYYTQKHEIEAQIKGLKRLSKLKREPFKKTVIDWFENNRHKHNLDKKSLEKVINIILKNNGN
jgi:hypothetical protein